MTNLANPAQQFLDALAQLGGSAGNVTLRETLGWDETTYNQIQSNLRFEGKIVPGRGRGGSVSLPGHNGAPPEPAPTATAEEMERFLSTLHRLGGASGNVTLREALRLEEEDYFRIQKSLIGLGKIQTGKGRGGSVTLTGKAPAPSLFDEVSEESQGEGNSRVQTVRDNPFPEKPKSQPVVNQPSPSQNRSPVAPDRVSASTKPTSSGQRFELAFKNIDDILWKDAGCTSELDYTEQTSWLLFLKYLDALEHDKATEAAFEGKEYSPILDAPYRWEKWAAPKGSNGEINHNTALTGDDLIVFVNQKLFPYLHGFKQKATGPNTIEYKIGEIFGEIKNRIQSGYNLREIIDHIDELRFGSQSEKHELSHLYEAKIKNMGNAGRNGGEYYTPRPLIRAIVAVTAPQIGETICDPAVGSAGFLCESFDYLRAQNPQRTTAQDQTLQERTFYGKEKKSLAYVIAIMNMILHGIEAPNIIHTNTLAENLADVQERDRFDIIVANPPFGGKERKEVQQNFPIRTGETAFLFLQHFIKILKAGGRAGIVIKNTFLSNTDNASVLLRMKLLEECNLHSVLDCPGGTFIGAGVKTVVLFFEKGTRTQKVWYYQLDPGRNMGKTNPLNDADLAEFIELQKTRADSPKSWSVDVSAIDTGTYDLSVKNPNGGEEITHRTPQEIMEEIAALDAESAEVLANIRQLLNTEKTDD